jgi:hypothetical protein
MAHTSNLDIPNHHHYLAIPGPNNWYEAPVRNQALDFLVIRQVISRGRR